MLTSAHAFLTRARPRMNPGGMRSPEILKCCSERWVWAPQRRSAGTSMGPKVSFSIRVGVVMASPSTPFYADGARRSARRGRGRDQTLELGLHPGQGAGGPRVVDPVGHLVGVEPRS